MCSKFSRIVLALAWLLPFWTNAQISPLFDQTTSVLLAPANLWTANQSGINSALAYNLTINGGVPNGSGSRIHWSQLLGVPAGFADNSDDGAGGGGGTGDVVGPAAATDNAMALFSGTTGKLIKNSGISAPGLTNLFLSGYVDVGGVLTVAGYITTQDTEAYGPGWSGSFGVPTKAALYTKLQAAKKRYVTFQRPDYGDGSGAVPQTNNATVSGLMHYTFSGSAETNVNYVVYEMPTPYDLDTTVPMTAIFRFLGGGSSSSAYVFHLTYAQALGGSVYPSTIINSPIVITVTPGSVGANFMHTSAETTLTNWSSSLFNGSHLLIKVARLDNANNDTARDVALIISYGSTQ